MKPYVKRNFFISELRNRSFFLSICKDFLRDDTKLLRIILQSGGQICKVFSS